ncbi:MAG: GspE/PulE family protein [Actinomycetota bacterium]|nr:GspE/PulE family protein [Actinomycetota bacterium]
MKPIRLAEVELRPRLGNLLVESGAITREQLDAALAEKGRSGQRLGEILLERGWASERALARALAEQYDLAFVDLASAPLDQNVAALLPESFARRLRALPIGFADDDETLLVAVADPTNVVTSDDLRMALGVNVRLVVTESSQIDRAISSIYGSGDEVELAGSTSVGRRRQESIDANAAESAPVIGLVNAVIRQAIERRVSDIHFEPQPSGLVVRGRVDGVMRQLDVIPHEMQHAVVSRLKVMGELDIAERRLPQDGRVSIKFGRTSMDLRMAILPTIHGEQIVLRILYLRDSPARDLTELGMAADTEAEFRRAITRPYGCVVTCGPTGSGKTTTLYAGLELLNEPGRVLTTIEDPVESQIDGVNQIEVNPKAGLTFARGLRTVLRSDPDVLLVGEIRDEETARIAIQAAMTGHLVLTTLHAQDAASSIARLKDMGVSPLLISTAVNCVIAQRLVRRLCGECREPYRADAAFLRGRGLASPAADGDVTLYRARGCVACGDGYSGRLGIYELLPIRGAIARLMEAPTEEIAAAAVAEGMRTLNDDALRVCLSGATSVEEVMRVTGDQDLLRIRS